MTGPEDSQPPSRPISVAELLAKNGTIGAPPVGGRRRRRRGNADAVTVAELTGEIPVVTDDPAPQTARGAREPDPGLEETTVVEAVPAADDEPRPARNGRNGSEPPGRSARAEETDEPRDSVPAVEPVAEPVAEAAAESAADTRDPEADYDAHLKARDVDPEPVEFRPRPRRPFTSGARDFTAGGAGAEQMSPDPLDDLDDGRTGSGFATGFDAGLDTDDPDLDTRDAADASYPLGSLFGGPSVDDDLDRDSDLDRDLDADLDVEDDEYTDELSDDELDEEEGSPLVRGLWVVAQCIIAVAFGAGLFVAFDQLWKWNTIVALVLGVLVILGLAGGVRVVRKTEDIGSTLTAVAVGALVTFGPLALLQAS
ncbi:hypothetical protein [Mycolicibacterium goodii]|uniref:FUSC family protein n=1 Tax=Mycolicibacterium goodii TaxID=134601 RepID=A0A0K0WZJ8_MYCGD|nr:hypothetical protein AFA91_00480 [Mycolicibacterium goodii]